MHEMPLRPQQPAIGVGILTCTSCMVPGGVTADRGAFNMDPHRVVSVEPELHQHNAVGEMATGQGS